MVHIEGDDMGRSPGTPNGNEKLMPEEIGQGNIATTAEPMHIRSTTYHKESKKSPGRCGNNHESIDSNGLVPRRLYQQYTSKRKIEEGHPIDKRGYER